MIIADRAIQFASNALRPLAQLLDDPAIIEVMVNGSSGVYVERLGRGLELTDLVLTEDAITGMVTSLAAVSRKEVDLTGDKGHLIVSARMPGLRIEAQLPPVAIGGPYVTIRKHGTKRLTLDDYVRDEVLTQEVAEILRAAIDRRDNLIVSGGTSTGKTTFLNALVAQIPAHERLLAIETVAELQFSQHNVLRFEADDEQGYSVQRLVKSALRTRPDRVLIGEVRGGEAFDFMDAANTGHPGSMASLHANSAEEALDRLENLILEGRPAMPLLAIRTRVAKTFNVIVQMVRVQHASQARVVRRIGQVLRIDGFDRTHDRYLTTSLYTFDPESLS